MTSKPKESLLLWIDPNDIQPNKENPRLLFDEEELTFLKKSINEVGILVPLLVYRRSADSRYVLLDGERRWRCAQDLGLKKIPCNQIEEPDKLTNILHMFNIHNSREEWEVVPTALKLQTLMRLLGDKPNTELARLTGMSSIRVGECKRVLSFPKKYLDLALLGKPEERITGDFFSQLHRFVEEVETIPELRKEFSRNRITEIMIKKYRDGTFPAILDFRILKKALEDARKIGVEERHIVKTTRTFLKSVPHRRRRSKPLREVTVDKRKSKVSLEYEEDTAPMTAR